MALPLDHLDLLDEPVATSTGAPRLIPLADIDEDPEQPRQEFDEGRLAGLADTIRQRGVLQAISVRSHPSAAGRWMLNYGARRLRASRLAGQADIPAFVDRAADDYAQVIENEQREGLTVLELALFVKKRLARGDSQATIARLLGKSPAHITMVCAMIDPPDWLLDAYRSGRCRGVSELYELRRLHESRPDAVRDLLARPETVSRASMRSIRSGRSAADRVAAADSASEGKAGEIGNASPAKTACSDVAAVDTLLQHAERLCGELASTLDRLEVLAPDRVPALSRRIAAMASREAGSSL
jgi:ParB family transcriptional regulator, chromosome partitioning protein